MFNRRGSLFDDLEWEFDRMNREFDRFFREARQTGNLELGTPIVYGYSIEIGSDGVPHVEHFGNTPDRQSLEEGLREPFTSVQPDEDKGLIRVTSEMPGVDKDSIRVRAAENRVTIEAEGPDRKYRKELRLPTPIAADSSKARYHNGILEVTLETVRPQQTLKDVTIE